MALVAQDSERITFDSTAGGIGFTAAKLTTKVLMATVRLEQAQVRIRVASGVTLTAGGAEGSPKIEVGETFEVWGSDDLKNFRGIRTGTISGLGQVIYYGQGCG